ncbi:MAG: histidine--tRNA ligase [Candidatus Cloacimonadia bacterium]
MKYQAPRGTFDILPEEIYRWHYLENIIKKNANLYNYKEIRFPIFEQLELFQRSVGETSDIVEKEMYIFKDKAGRRFALRPEGTACIARAYIEHKMQASHRSPLRLFYLGPMFRYSRPQKGRYRQFYQFGFEYLGVPDPIADAEIIALGWKIYQDTNIPNVRLEINSIGCPKCRKTYNEKLRTFLLKNKSLFCSDCQRRMEVNPLRVFDCKRESCQNLLQEAPTMLENLCEECDVHFQTVQNFLSEMEVPFTVNPRIVRGLDYYTRTAFEYKIDYLGAQDAIGGGGRYDDLIEQLGGPATPAVGLSGGLERVILSLKYGNVPIPPEPTLDALVIPFDDSLLSPAIKICNTLHQKNISAVIADPHSSLKSNLRYCDANQVKFAVIIGEDEIRSKKFIVKDIQDKVQEAMPIPQISNYITQRIKNKKKL